MCISAELISDHYRFLSEKKKYSKSKITLKKMQTTDTFTKCAVIQASIDTDPQRLACLLGKPHTTGPMYLPTRFTSQPSFSGQVLTTNSISLIDKGLLKL